MPEQYVNNAVTTLAADITDSATTCSLSDASDFPAIGDFRLRWSDSDELALCTARAGASCTITRGVEGTTATAHTAGATVSHVLTAEALGNIIDEAIAAAAGTGDVVGPASSVDDRIATFDGTTGKLLQDGGLTIAQVIAAAAGGAGDVVGPASSVDDRIATFDGTTGKLLQDGGKTIAQVLAEAAGGASDPKSAIYTPFTPGTDDDEFDDGSFSGWTAVQAVSPTMTFTETGNSLSILHPGGGSAAQFSAWVKARTINTDDWIEACFRWGGKMSAYHQFGLVMADGNTYNAGKQMINAYSPIENTSWMTKFTNYNASGGATNLGNLGYGEIFMRLKWMGGNNFRAYASPDGVSWAETTGGNFAYGSTIAPAYAGFCLTSWGSTVPFAWSVRYVRFGNG